MIKKIRKYLKLTSIDIFVYRMNESDTFVFSNPGFTLESGAITDSKKEFLIRENGLTVHRSYVFNKLHVLGLIGKSGPAIGDCVTIPQYKGKSIYPFVINHLALTILSQKQHKEMFIIVNSDNASSIRGIEKAGFSLFKKIQAKRFLLFYFQVKIQ